jgi:1,6-anhydro-N-acetylmuramate kinase
LWILTSRDRRWWRNVKNGAEVSLLLKKRPVQGFAEAELDAQAVEAHLFEYIKHVPMAAKPLGIRMENNTANAEDVARAARDRLFVKIKI